MVKEGNQLVEQYKETAGAVQEHAPDRRGALQGRRPTRRRCWRTSSAGRPTCRTSASTPQQSLQQRFNNFRSLLLDEISKKVTEIAKRKGATLVVDKSGPSLAGIPA